MDSSLAKPMRTRVWMLPVLCLVALTGVFIGTMVGSLFNGARRDVQLEHYDRTKSVQKSLEDIEDRLIKNIDRLKRNEAVLNRLEQLHTRMDKIEHDRLVRPK